MTIVKSWLKFWHGVVKQQTITWNNGQDAFMQQQS